MNQSQAVGPNGEIIINSGISPSSVKTVYKCDACDASYTDKAYFELHKQTHQSKDFSVVQIVMNNSTPQIVSQQGSTQVIVEEDQVNSFKRNFNVEPHQIYTIAPGSQYQIIPASSQPGSILTHAVQNFGGNTFVMASPEGNHFPAEIITANEEVDSEGLSKNSANQEIECEEVRKNSTSHSILSGSTNVKKNIKSPKVTVGRPSNPRSRIVNSNNRYRPFKCDQCTASFLEQNELEEHSRKHTDDGPFTCEDCQFTFMYKSHFRSHKTRCLKKRSAISKLPTNIVSTPIKREFPTNDSHKVPTTKQVSQLTYRQNNTNILSTEHSAVTSKVNNTVVYKQPLARQNTNKHQYQKFNPSNPSFKRLKRDIQLDRPFECDECDASFQSDMDLRNHKMKHTGEGPFTCQECKFVFLYRKLYEAHKRRCEKKKRDTEPAGFEEAKSVIFESPSSTVNPSSHEIQNVQNHIQEENIIHSSSSAIPSSSSIPSNAVTGTIQLPAVSGQQPAVIELRPSSQDQSEDGQQTFQIPNNSVIEQVLVTPGTPISSIIGGRHDVKYEIVPIPAGMIDLSEGVVNMNQLMNLIKVKGLNQ